MQDYTADGVGNLVAVKVVTSEGSGQKQYSFSRVRSIFA